MRSLARACVAALLVLTPAVAQPEASLGRGAQPTTQIMGQVVDALGRPIPACRVVATAWSGEHRELAKTFSDGEGVFVLSVIADGKRVAVRALAEARVGPRQGVRAKPGSKPERLVLRLWDAGSVRGRVIDREGRGVSGAHVVAAHDATRVLGSEGQATAVTDADGGFALETVALGWNQVRAWKAGFELGEASVWLRGSATVDVRLEAGSGVSLIVEVKGRTGAGRARVSVRAFGRGGATNTAPWSCRRSDERARGVVGVRVAG